MALDWLLPEALVVVRKRELFVGGDGSKRNERHDRPPFDDPLLRLAVGVARVVDVARERALFLDIKLEWEREGKESWGKRGSERERERSFGEENEKAERKRTKTKKRKEKPLNLFRRIDGQAATQRHKMVMTLLVLGVVPLPATELAVVDDLSSVL